MGLRDSLQHHLNGQHLACRFASWGFSWSLAWRVGGFIGGLVRPLIYRRKK
jgi:hypothetical protein